MPRDERNAFVIAGIGAMYLFLFSFTRTIRRYHIGIWRGVVRPFIFFLGAAVASCSGAAWGMFNLRGDEAIGALAAILGGTMVSLFVWLVPVGPFQKLPPIPTPEDADQRRTWAKRLKVLGIGGLIFDLCLLVILAATLGNDFEEAGPALCIPLFILSTTALVVGFFKGRVPSAPKVRLALPLRRSFEVSHESFSLDGVTQIFNLMDTHLMLAGFRPQKLSDLVRSYTRGRRFTNLWDSDIRHWSTRLNVAIYQIGDLYRVTCHLDLDSDFVKPSEKMLAELNEELVELQQVLAGREISSNTPVHVRVEA